MPEARGGVPPVPVLADELLDAYDAAHRTAARAVTELGPHLDRTFRAWSISHMLVALAGRSPSLSGVHHPPLVPSTRGFLSFHDHERIAGVRAAFEHIDVRIALVQAGIEPVAIRPETPYVLHALAEGRTTGVDETNAGIPRTKVAGWLEKVSPYVHPPAELVRPIIDELVAVAATSVEAPAAVGAWAAFTWMSAHPWADGNGRTGRLLLLLRTGPHLDLALDYGVVEQLTFHRGAYIAALQKGQHTTPVYDPELLDARPFAEAATEWSIAGADLVARRAALLGIAAEQLARARPDLDEVQLSLALRIGLFGTSPAEVCEEPDPEVHSRTVVPVAELEELCTWGILVRSPLPPSRRPSSGRPQPPIGYAASEEVIRAIGHGAATVTAAHG